MKTLEERAQLRDILCVGSIWRSSEIASAPTAASGPIHNENG